MATKYGPMRIQTLRANVLNAIYFRRDLTCTLVLTNNLVDGGQPRAKNGFSLLGDLHYNITVIANDRILH